MQAAQCSEALLRRLGLPACSALFSQLRETTGSVWGPLPALWPGTPDSELDTSFVTLLSGITVRRCLLSGI